MLPGPTPPPNHHASPVGFLSYLPHPFFFFPFSYSLQLWNEVWDHSRQTASLLASEL